MSHVVAIAGGSGALGRTIIDALKKSTYKPLILARQVNIFMTSQKSHTDAEKANQALESDIGVPVLQADYSNQESLIQLFESHKIDTVISCITNYSDSHNVEQQQRDPVSHIATYPASGLRLTIQLGQSFRTITTCTPGRFKSALAIDMDGNAAGIPGDGNYPVYFTHTTDVAKYTAALLGLDHWQKKYFVYGDEMTWNEAVAISQAMKGVKFNITYDAIEKLERGEITELTGHKATYAHLLGSDSADAKAMFQRIMSGVVAFMAEGHMVYEAPLLNEIFPDIKALKVKEAMTPNSAA
ncbi:hypothetical protein PMIN04_000644 [Paraphaeosphaeria minitans]|uniref:Isoflavone reductase IRL 2-like protein n=1 Tax=Paraphaeosphaeria minitans TaxID=565426 RepID=A0A9P6GFW3_9PLEO|nr:Isoflavone reductase IRL 2-like protein [Paraphaeosphaeria minitans]